MTTKANDSSVDILQEEKLPVPTDDGALIRVRGTTEVWGYFYDKETGEPINATLQLFWNATGQALNDPFTTDNYSYSAWVNTNDTYKIDVVFTAEGYKPVKIRFADLEQDPDIYFERAETSFHISPWMIAAVMLAVIVYREKNRKKRVGKLETKDVFPILMLVGGYLGFLVVKKILEHLGVLDDKDERALDEIAGDPNSFWNPNYWQTIKPADKNWTYAITTTTAKQWIKEIVDSFGAFNDNEEKAIGIMKRCRTKANCSFLAWVFNEMYGEDLLEYLRGGHWPQDRLSNEHVKQIHDYIAKLPNY